MPDDSLAYTTTEDLLKQLEINNTLYNELFTELDRLDAAVK